jgi:predicted secreted protein
MMEGSVIMARSRAAWTFSRGAAIALIALGLVACGETAAPVDSGTQITPPVPLSPTAGEIPEETFQATATITDEGLDPDQFSAVSGTAFQLVVQGDGKEHTFEIQELVAPRQIAPQGQTTIDFTVVGDPAELDILLDGKSVGTFERQAASGATDS